MQIKFPYCSALAKVTSILKIAMSLIRRYLLCYHMVLTVICLSILSISDHAHAHVDGLSKNRLDLFEISATEFRILWRNLSFDLVFKLPEDCAKIKNTAVWQCQQALSGREIVVEKLSTYKTEAVVRIQYIDRSVQVRYLSEKNNRVKIKRKTIPVIEAISTYLILGVEHIFLGVDHILFVFGLVLILVCWRSLLTCITSFTVAHSATLALSTFDIIVIPIAPIEAVIALSIVLLAAEYGKKIHGERSYIDEHPAKIGFGIGLIHGLGYASVLKQLGLPSGQYLPSLISFNLGVEIGQILFIFVTLGVIRFLSPFTSVYQKTIQRVGMYGLGSISAFWFVERTAMILFG